MGVVNSFMVKNNATGEYEEAIVQDDTAREIANGAVQSALAAVEQVQEIADSFAVSQDFTVYATPFSALQMRAGRVGPVVQIAFTCSGSISVGAGQTLLTTLPALLRPKLAHYQISMASPSQALYIVVEASGAIKFQNPLQTEVSVNPHLSFCYIAA